MNNEELWSAEAEPKFLKLHEQDRKKFGVLSRVLSLQKTAIKEDSDLRGRFVLTEEGFDVVQHEAQRAHDELQALIEKMASRGGKGNFPNAGFPPSFVSEEVKRRSDAMKETLYRALPKNLRDSRVLDGVEQKGLLMNFAQILETKRAQECEERSWKILEALQTESLNVCDKCFTTSQRGAESATEHTKKDPKYDSIYYLHALSSGTYLSQRFKRNNIAKGLAGVVQPVAPLCLFVSKGDGMKIKAGEYAPSQISSIPQSDFTLYEYFTETLSPDLRNGVKEIRIPDDIEVTPDGIVIKNEISSGAGQYIDIHEGGVVNKIIKG